MLKESVPGALSLTVLTEMSNLGESPDFLMFIPTVVTPL